MDTVSAENVTVRPAVAAVRPAACATGRPAARPSPNLFTMSRLESTPRPRPSSMTTSSTQGATFVT